jgi:hypothetical protein
LPTDDDFADPQAFARAELDWDISELDHLGKPDDPGSSPSEEDKP